MGRDRRANTRRPDEFEAAHGLVLALHDILLQQLHAGYRGNAWVEEAADLTHDELEALRGGEHPLEWFLRTQERARSVSLLTRTVYPFLLSDILHFVYEAMESTRKGKLTVAFALLRKPLKESLYVLELITADPAEFAAHFKDNVALLYSEANGKGRDEAARLQLHASRIDKALLTAGCRDDFDPLYLAKLRYGRAEDDSFASSFDKSIHLVTTFKAIATESMNFNFIFSDGASLMTQWSYIYSRLPYVMAYIWRICETSFGRFGISDPVYLAEMDRRIEAMVSIWWPSVDQRYRTPELEAFANNYSTRLAARCVEAGWRPPTSRDLRRMARTGAWPGESSVTVKLRAARFAVGAKIAGIIS